MASQNIDASRTPTHLIPIRCGCKPYSLPRSFRTHEVVDPGALSVRGAAPKWIIRNTARREEFYISKRSEKWGEIETYTEFFLNQFGTGMGFEMAESGLARLDGTLHFVSRSFLRSGELLSHGSVIAQE